MYKSILGGGIQLGSRGYSMDMDKQKRLLQVLNLLSPFIAGLIIIFSGVDSSAAFADSGDKILSPAGFTFAIWGPIFIFQGLFYFYQARDIFKPASERIDMPYVQEVGVFFMLSWVSTSLWLVLWGSGLVWPGIAAMFAYLVTSLGAYMRLGINKRKRTLREHIFVTVSWSMLCGWVTVAAIVNTTSGLVLSGFDTGVIGEVWWTILVLLIALLIYLLVLITRNDFIFTGVGVWALIGTAASLLNPLKPPQPEVTIVAFLGIVILLVAIVGWYLRLRKLGIVSSIPLLIVGEEQEQS